MTTTLLAPRHQVRNVYQDPWTGLWKVLQRLTKGYTGKLTTKLSRALKNLKLGLAAEDFIPSIKTGDADEYHAAREIRHFIDWLGGEETIADLLKVPAINTGYVVEKYFHDFSGLNLEFTATDPRIVQFARRQAAELVVAITDAQREAVRVVLALAQARGLTIETQAQAIRFCVGLPPNWASAPMNLGLELRDGRFTRTRFMAVSDKKEILRRLADKSIDEEFIQTMQSRYQDALIYRRSLNIARTETNRAAHHGLNVSWQQAADQGLNPPDAKRVWIVTPDDRLRWAHAQVPLMNPDGVGLDEPFETPLGPAMSPPLEPNCRCSLGLMIRGRVV